MICIQAHHMSAQNNFNQREPGHQHDIQRVRMLFRMWPRSIVITLGVSSLAAGVLHGTVEPLLLWAWYGAAILVAIGRFSLYWSYRESNSVETNPLAWEYAVAVGAGMMGLVWAGLALLGPLTGELQLFVVLVMGGVSLGSAGVLGASRYAFIAFNAPLLLAVIGKLFYLGGTLYNTMGAMAAMFAAGLVVAFIEFRRALLASIDAQTEVERANRQQRLIFESVTAGVAYIRERRIIDYNPQFARMLGYERHELIGSPTKIYYSDEAKWREIGEQGYAALARGEAYHQEYDFRTKSGGTITCDATMQSVVPGKPEQGVVAILNDITVLKQRETALRTALLQQLAIFSHAPAGIIMTRKRLVEDCNGHMAKMLGAPLESIIGKTTEGWFGSRERWEIRGTEIYSAFARGEPCEYTEEFVRLDGSRFWCKVRGGAIDPNDPVNGAAVFVLVDVTEQRLAEAALRESREQMMLVVRAAQSGIVDHHMTTRETTFSDRFCEILGFAPSARTVELMPIMDRVHREDRLRVKAAYISHLKRHTPINETFRLRRADSSWVWVRGHGQAQWDAAGKPTRFVGSITDITEIRQQEEEIHRLALEDPLTGLPNRRLLEDRLERALSAAARNQEQVAVLMIDLDGFKDVNDEFGHAAGDTVLKTLAGRLKQSVRDSDTVARTGGDEFVVLVRAIQQPSDAAALAENLLAAIGEPIRDGNVTLRVGASIGIAMYPADTLHPAQLVRMADKAMYDVKQSGRNNFRLAAQINGLPAGNVPV